MPRSLAPPPSLAPPAALGGDLLLRGSRAELLHSLPTTEVLSGYLKDRGGPVTPGSPNSEPTQGRRWTDPATGAVRGEVTAGTQDTPERPAGSFSARFGHSKHLCTQGDLESHSQAQEGMHAQRRPEKPPGSSRGSAEAEREARDLEPQGSDLTPGHGVKTSLPITKCEPRRQQDDMITALKGRKITLSAKNSKSNTALQK